MQLQWSTLKLILVGCEVQCKGGGEKACKLIGKTVFIVLYSEC